MSRKIKKTLILASGSAGRKSMLQNAGLEFRAIPADIDEASITTKMLAAHKPAKNITQELAVQKALYISKRYPDALVIGSDQTLVLKNKIYSKAKDKKEAIQKLKELRGKKHILNSAVCIAHNNRILWKTISTAQLKMKLLDDKFINTYAKAAEEILTTCVGAYQIEGRGAWLFSEIKGDVYTIMGMPLMPLLDYLHKKHEIKP